ncbi:hypothetical protein, partial [Marinomonas arenicola]
KQVLSELAGTSVGGGFSKDPVLPNVKVLSESESLLKTIAGSDEVTSVMAKARVVQGDGDASSKRIQQVRISSPAQ